MSDEPMSREEYQARDKAVRAKLVESADRLTETLMGCSDEDRVLFMQRLLSRFCVNCGKVRGEYPCQCENDE